MPTRLAWLLAAGIALSLPITASDSIPLSEFHQRREMLRKATDGVVVLFGKSSAEEEGMREGFFQEPFFYYFSGWRYPDAILLLSKSEDMLFLPARNERHERYYGHRPSAGDSNAPALTGFTQVLPVTDFEAQLTRIAGLASKVYTIPDPVNLPKLKGLLAMRPKVEVLDGSKMMSHLRMVKSPAEIRQIEEAVRISIEGQRAAAQRAAPGVHEYQIATTMRNVWFEQGCEREAYPPIIGSGPNSVILHYWEDRRQMDRGEVVVMDAAAECRNYAADITRTIPVSGHFTPRQREIYDIVLGAQQAAIDAIRPGAYTGGKDRAGSLWNIAYQYIDTHGKSSKGEPLGKYSVHGVSHHVGLDVHDAADYDRPLAPGMIVTVEPGIYLPDENLGVRIEDMVLVTETGHRVLTEALPRTPEEVERLLEKHHAPRAGSLR